MKRIREAITSMLRTAFTGSTLLEVEWHPGNPKLGGLLRVPGYLPERERSLWWRLNETVRSTWA